MTIEPTGVPLAEFVAGLREQIRTAQKDADPEFPIEVGPVTVEFTVLSRQEGEGHAGVKFWVVDAGVKGTTAKEATQKVTMQLQPLAPDGRSQARIRDVE